MTTNSINVIINQANQAEIITDSSKAIVNGLTDGHGDSDTLPAPAERGGRTGASPRANCGPPPGATATPSSNWPP